MNTTPNTNKYGARALHYFIFAGLNWLIAPIFLIVIANIGPSYDHQQLDLFLAGGFIGQITMGFLGYIAAAICGVEHLIRD